MNKRILILRTFSFLLAVSLFIGTVFSVDLVAATFADISAPEVFTKQPSGSVTCTLHANAMMLRRYAMLRGDIDWADITADAMQPTCWINGAGMRGAYTYKDISVTQASLPGSYSDKKSHLIEFLKLHPEGVALFDANKPHAVILTDYTDGQFYYADPSSGAPSGRMLMTDTSSVTISTADKYWYVKSELVTIQAADLSVIESPVPGDTFNADYINVSGWSISMKGVTFVRCVVNNSFTLDCTQTERTDVAELNPGYPTGKEGFECKIPFYAMTDGDNTIRIDSYSGEKIINSVSVNINYTYKGSHNVADGVYYIQSVADDSYVLSAGDNAVSGSDLILNSKNNSLVEKFTVKHLKDGYYKITVAGSDLSIGANDGTLGPETSMELTEYKNDGITDYIIKSAGNGEYFIICKGGYYLGTQDETMVEGTNIISQYGNGETTQRWRFINADPDVVVWGDSNDDMCVDVKDAVIMKQHIAGIDVEIDMTISDVNVDNKVDIKDAVKLMKHLSGMDVVLGQSDN